MELSPKYPPLLRDLGPRCHTYRKLRQIGCPRQLTDFSLRSADSWLCACNGTQQFGVQGLEQGDDSPREHGTRMSDMLLIGQADKTGRCHATRSSSDQLQARLA